MPLMSLSDQQIKERQDALRNDLVGAMTAPADAGGVVNQEYAERLGKTRSFEFPAGSGVMYDVPNVPYDKGIKVHSLFTEIRKSQKHGEEFLVSHYELLLKQMLQIVWSLSYPRSRFKKLLKKIGLLRNPFLKASEGDIASLISFFLVRRMMQNVQYHYPA